MLANFDIPLSWPELIKRTVNETMSDDAQGLASQLAYCFFLALLRARPRSSGCSARWRSRT